MTEHRQTRTEAIRMRTVLSLLLAAALSGCGNSGEEACEKSDAMAQTEEYADLSIEEYDRQYREATDACIKHIEEGGQY